MALTQESMRADIARIIGMEPSEIGDHDNLADLGLDSLRLMDLTTSWEEAGLKADFGIFAEYATLAEWWREVEKIQAGG